MRKIPNDANSNLQVVNSVFVQQRIETALDDSLSKLEQQRREEARTPSNLESSERKELGLDSKKKRATRQLLQIVRNSVRLFSQTPIPGEISSNRTNFFFYVHPMQVHGHVGRSKLFDHLGRVKLFRVLQKDRLKDRSVPATQQKLTSLCFLGLIPLTIRELRACEATTQ
jgi:hypothetical protein